MKIKGFNFRRYEGVEFTTIAAPQNTLKRKHDTKRIAILQLGLGLFTVIFIGTLMSLQVVHGGYYRNLAERNRIRVKEEKPVRGIIYDRNHIPLVKNEPQFSLLAIPLDIYKQETIIVAIISELEKKGIGEEELLNIKKKLKKFSYLPVVLVKNISYEDGIKLLPTIDKWHGVYLQEQFAREYSFKELLSHIIGYTAPVTEQDLVTDSFYSSSDIKGKSGVELVYEKQLRGTKGETHVQVNSLGEENRLIQYIPSKKGTELTLTIDSAIQEQLNHILQEYMKKYGVTRASAIVLNPNTGEIIALISLPSFDNNLFTHQFNQADYEALFSNSDNPLFNRAIAGEYPPGSTFKLIVGAAALQEGIIDSRFTVTSTGGIQVGMWHFPDWKAGGHGVVNIREALAWSVNTFFYTIGGGYGTQQGLGLQRLIAYGKKFNLGGQTGIDLPSEGSGFLPSEEWKLEKKKEPWYLGDTYHLSIGQGDLLVTPLQVALWTSFFANRGTLYVPHVVKKESSDIIDKNLISSNNIEVIREGLRDAVRYGSAQSLNNLSTAVAGKTGTAQPANSKKPHGWFTGFAPYPEPEIVISILMEESGGAETATPIAREFIDWYFKKSGG